MVSEQAWIEKLAELRAARVPCAMVVVADVQGSAPREAGARMIVADGRLAWGTIGGGNLEKLAIERAAESLGNGSAESFVQRFPLGEAAGQCCGGAVTLFFESFPWSRGTLAIFGAGHVGQALASLAPWLDADVRLFDARDEATIQPPLPPAAERPYTLLCVDAPAGELDELPDDALVLVMTHSHALDQELIEQALRRPFPYIGLIGSARKWQRFQERLQHKGVSAEQLARVRCPIGLVQGSKEPKAIALSTATELTEILRSRQPQ